MRMIFVNLPVKDLKASTGFFSELGFEFNPTEAITCLSADSKEQVDETVAKAIAAGGQPWQPNMDEGPMYGGSFQDLDGHVWELMYMERQ